MYYVYLPFSPFLALYYVKYLAKKKKTHENLPLLLQEQD